MTYAMTYELFCHMVSKAGQADHSEFFRVPWSAVDEHKNNFGEVVHSVEE